jgi:D-3-phosphoglycerate dehydrogenase
MSIRQPKVLHPIDNEDLKLLVLENISQGAVNAFESQGFQVDQYPKAMSEDELVEKIPQYHAIGIRSKTRITERVLKSATKAHFFLF